MKIKKMPYTEVYMEVSLKSNEKLESNDCAVKTVSVAAGIDYATVHERFSKHGRKSRKGASTAMMLNVMRSFGFGWQTINMRVFIESRYPGRHRCLKSVTSHHPDRFPSAFNDGSVYIMVTVNHAFAVRDGAVHDYSRNAALRVIGMYKVWKTS